MTARKVPSKIVIAGNSKMSLNDRFSSIPRPRPKTVMMKPQSQRIPAPMKKANPQQYNEMDYAPKPVIRRPRPTFQHRAVPFQSRVSFVSTVPIQRFPQRNNFVQRNPQFQNNFRRPFRPNFNQQHPNRKFFHNNNHNNRFQNNGGFQGRKTFPTLPKKKSLADLDRELDDYMRKPKHTPITV
ncbi:hypothetical protein CRE_03883 [Caenorhabditis remanei]|uniref:Chromatin target of PRMT1 protein C-terminal domain-containing protein n=1 Tax=Caenorhabditis remanei TaxID=31234 RepID=E3LXN1_CAERE|nr:hypothetical protein CRE_03883 [Caenorhabditis remanei]